MPGAHMCSMLRELTLSPERCMGAPGSAKPRIIEWDKPLQLCHLSWDGQWAGELIVGGVRTHWRQRLRNSQ
jgi:hypothetical protein